MPSAGSRKMTIWQVVVLVVIFLNSCVHSIIRLNLLMKFNFHDFRQWYLTVAKRYLEIKEFAAWICQSHPLVFSSEENRLVGEASIRLSIDMVTDIVSGLPHSCLKIIHSYYRVYLNIKYLITISLYIC